MHTCANTQTCKHRHPTARLLIYGMHLSMRDWRLDGSVADLIDEFIMAVLRLPGGRRAPVDGHLSLLTLLLSDPHV